MEAGFFVKGLTIGLAIAAPVGPIGVLCIRRTLVDGRLAGFLSGLGAASADGFYGLVAGLGLSFVASLLVGGQQWIRLVGGLFLCGLGLKTLLARPPAGGEAWSAGTPKRTGLAAAYLSTLFLTLTNPVTILAFAGIFAGVGLTTTPADYGSAALLVLGVFAGSALWWFTLSAGISLLRSRITPAGLTWINRVSGLVIVGFGIVALAGLLG